MEKSLFEKSVEKWGNKGKVGWKSLRTFLYIYRVFGVCVKMIVLFFVDIEIENAFKNKDTCSCYNCSEKCDDKKNDLMSNYI
jgi:hypothetical protein